jgi:hypothetical protein
MPLFNLNRKPKAEYKIVSGRHENLDFVGHYDFKLLKYKSKSSYPYMLGISIQGFATDDRKLPTNDARPTIFEDKLTDLVKKSTESIYAGHSFWNGALEVIFYIRDYESVIKALESEAKKKSALTFTFRIDSDPRWQQLDYLTYTR